VVVCRGFDVFGRIFLRISFCLNTFIAIIYEQTFMKNFLTLLISFLCISSFAQENNGIAIIPKPVSVTTKAGQFILPKQVVIEADASGDSQYVVSYLTNKLNTSTGFEVKTSQNAANASIKFVLNKSVNTAIGDEGYELIVNSKQVLIKANKPAGLFYGVQSLLQLLPKEIESPNLVNNIAWTVPNVEITDYPRLGWRGLMLDVSRHFFTKDEVKQYIDAMVKYKYNLFHFHLTDDEGWRIEIKSLPRLTEVGAWNVKRVGTFGNFIPPTKDEPRDYGGFYTQDDIRELVQYARERFVNILHEIDVPGHSLAAIVAYPDLSCTAEANTYQVRSGEQIMDWSHGHPPLAMVDNTLCPANEKVYEFMDKVITEVAALFPFKYIHLGGDEAPMNFWKKSDVVKALMKREGYTKIAQAQGYFTARVEKIVVSKGKTFIGWDEVLEGGVPKSAAVMSWRGMKGGIEAAKEGHEVVMSPTTFAYIDYMQADAITEPRVYATLRLSKAYQFEPVPEGVDSKYIKGGQANLWSEQIYNIRQAEYMTWPRGFAIAESVWSPKEKKNWKDFFRRTEQHFKRLDAAQTKYAPSVYDPIFKVRKNSQDRLVVILESEVEGLDLFYTFDNSFPDEYYPKYTEPLVVPIDADKLRVISYRDGKPIGRMQTMPIEELKRRVENPE